SSSVIQPARGLGSASRALPLQGSSAVLDSVWDSARYLAPDSTATVLEIMISSRYLKWYPLYTMLSIRKAGREKGKSGYRHFCPAGRGLEVVGEKWSLLIVRDLLAGPRRFSELKRSLTAITPKWLSARLAALEAEGVVQREEAGQREVWYRLTPKGQALEPVIDALLVWGIDHALGWARPGEAIHPRRVVD